jgi:hypothetical protein
MALNRDVYKGRKARATGRTRFHFSASSAVMPASGGHPVRRAANLLRQYGAGAGPPDQVGVTVENGRRQTIRLNRRCLDLDLGFRKQVRLMRDDRLGKC